MLLESYLHNECFRVIISEARYDQFDFCPVVVGRQLSESGGGGMGQNTEDRNEIRYVCYWSGEGRRVK